MADRFEVYKAGADWYVSNRLTGRQVRGPYRTEEHARAEQQNMDQTMARPARLHRAGQEQDRSHRVGQKAPEIVVLNYADIEQRVLAHMQRKYTELAQDWLALEAQAGVDAPMRGKDNVERFAAYLDGVDVWGIAYESHQMKPTARETSAPEVQRVSTDSEKDARLTALEGALMQWGLAISKPRNTSRNSGYHPHLALLNMIDWLRRQEAAPAADPNDASATTRIGKWLSAALDDPSVCAEMKADIAAWFEAVGKRGSKEYWSARCFRAEGYVLRLKEKIENMELQHKDDMTRAEDQE